MTSHQRFSWGGTGNGTPPARPGTERPAAPPGRADGRTRSFGGIVIAVVVSLVVRSAFAHARAETWSDHEAAGGLVVSTPNAFIPVKTGPIPVPGMQEVNQTAESCYIEEVACDLPNGSTYDLDAGMQGVMALVAGKPGNEISGSVTSHEPVLGLPAQRCRFLLTRDGSTKPVSVLVFNSPTKAWGLIAIADKPDLDRIVGSLKFAHGPVLAQMAP